MQRNGRYKQAHLLSDSPRLESTIEISDETPLWRKFSGFQLLVLISSALQIGAGITCVGLAIMNMISPLWIATIMSMFGSVITMIGAYVFYETCKNVASVEKLSRDAIDRVIREQN